MADKVNLKIRTTKEHFVLSAEILAIFDNQRSSEHRKPGPARACLKNFLNMDG
jgi:hypothetical protein